VFLHRRIDGTIWTSGEHAGVEVKNFNTGLLRSRHVRSLDIAKAKINARLAPFCKQVVFVDPPEEPVRNRTPFTPVALVDLAADARRQR